MTAEAEIDYTDSASKYNQSPKGDHSPMSLINRALPGPATLSAFILLAVAPCIAQNPTDAPPNPPAPADMPLAPVPQTTEQEQVRTDAGGELRGMWVVRESLLSPASVHQVVVTAVKYHINALFVQVRGRGDAYYNSHREPRAEDLAHQPAAFDPLDQIVREGHAAGLQVHAWLNTYLTWSGSRAPYSRRHLWNARRDWFACDSSGRCSAVPNNRSEGAFLQPSSPQVQDHLAAVFTEVAANYDVDGIHFDYCRYCGSEYDFSAAALRRFRDYLLGRIPPAETLRFDRRTHTDRLAYVHAFGAEWAEWRRQQITDLVTRISRSVKSAKPYIEVSAAVFPDAQEAFAVRGQDWRGWLQSGVLDSVALMAYDKNTQRVLRQTREAIAIAGERHVYTGVGAWRLDAHDVAHKIAEIRKTGAAGVNLFSYGGVHSRPNYLGSLARSVFASRSAPRRLRWLPRRAPQSTAAPAPDAPRESGSE